MDALKLEECGRVLITADHRLVALDCCRCQAELFTQFEKFIAHIKQRHKWQPQEAEEQKIKTEALTAQTENERQEMAAEVILSSGEDAEMSESIEYLEEEEFDEAFALEEQEANLEFLSNDEAVVEVVEIQTMPAEHLADSATPPATKPQHFIRNTTAAAQPLRCTLCAKTFTKLKYLNVHRRRHAKDYPHRCPYDGCAHSTVTAAEMTTHLRVHTGDKPYACRQCARTFKTSSVLCQHQRKHAAPTLQCDRCPRAFHSSHQLRNHTSAHLDRRNYLCEFCAKAFTSAKLLYTHKQRTHSELRANFCSICQRCFPNIDYHLAQLHGDKRSSDCFGSPQSTAYRLIVEHLASSVKWHNLKTHMCQAGAVTYVDAHKQRRNEGAVEYSSSSDMRTAIEKLDGTDLNGFCIRLVEAHNNPR